MTSKSSFSSDFSFDSAMDLAKIEGLLVVQYNVLDDSNPACALLIIMN